MVEFHAAREKKIMKKKVRKHSWKSSNTCLCAYPQCFQMMPADHPEADADSTCSLFAFCATTNNPTKLESSSNIHFPWNFINTSSEFRKLVPRIQYEKTTTHVWGKPLMLAPLRTVVITGYRYVILCDLYSVFTRLDSLTRARRTPRE